MEVSFQWQRLTWKPAILDEHASRYLLITPEIREVDKEFKWVERKTILLFFCLPYFFSLSFSVIDVVRYIHSRHALSFIVFCQHDKQRGWRNTSTVRVLVSFYFFFFLGGGERELNQRLLLLLWTRANRRSSSIHTMPAGNGLKVSNCIIIVVFGSCSPLLRVILTLACRGETFIA